MAKVREVIDKYRPDFLWFDFGLGFVPETYKKDLLAHFYNTAAADGREVVVSYKDHDLPVGVGINDLELGQERELTYHEWITDSSVDNQGAWGYVRGAGYKTVGEPRPQPRRPGQQERLPPPQRRPEGRRQRSPNEAREIAARARAGGSR